MRFVCLFFFCQVFFNQSFSSKDDSDSETEQDRLDLKKSVDLRDEIDEMGRQISNVLELDDED